MSRDRELGMAVAGGIIGTAIGVVGALLLAPVKGAELRREIGRKARSAAQRASAGLGSRVRGACHSEDQ